MRAFLIGLGIFLAALVAAVLVVPGLLDWNDYRDWAAARLGAWTGSTVSIHGDLSIRTFPAPTLVAGDVHIASLPGAAHDKLLTVGTVRVTIPWLPLLGGEIAVEQLTLTEPRLILERREDESLGHTLLPMTQDAGGAVRLADVRIENGTLIRLAPDGNAALRLDRIFATLSAESLAGPFVVTAECVAGDIPLQLEARGGRLSPAGALPLNLRLGIDGVDGALSFAGLLEANGRAQGDVRLEGLDPAAALAPHVPDPVPPNLLLALDGHRLSGRGNLAYDGERLSLSDLAVEAGETRAEGTVTWRFGEPAALEADLAVNQVDFDDDWAEARQPLARALLALSRLRGVGPAGSLTTRLALAIDAVRINEGLARNVRLRAGWADGLLTLERASAELPGGSAAALAGTIAWSEALPEADVQVHATASDLRAVLAWLGADLSDIAAGVLRRATMTARFSGSHEAFQLTGIDVTVDNTRVRGGVAVLDRDIPGLGLRVDVDRLDLDAYRPAPVNGPGVRPPAMLRYLAGRVPAWSHAVNVNIDAVFGRLVVDDIEMADLSIIATLRNGRLDLHDVMAGSVEGASLALSGAVAALDPLDGLDLAVDLVVPDAAPVFRLFDREPPVSPAWLGRLAADGRVAYEDRTLRVDLAGEAAGGRYEVSGSVADPAGAPSLSLAARLRHDDLLALLVPFVGGYRPAGPLGGLDLYAEIAGSSGNLALEAVQGRLGPVPLAGTVTLDRRDDRLRLAADLQAGDIALDRLLPLDPAWAAGRGSGAWSDRPVDLSLLTRLDGSLALTAASLSRGPFTVETPALRAELADGIFSLDRLTGRLFDGTFGLSGSVAAGPPVRASVALDLVGADAAAALSATGAGPAIAGALSFGFDGTMQGQSPASMVAGLAGDGVLSVREGRLSGLDLAALEAIIADSPDATTALLALPEALSGGSTPFAALNAPFAIRAGVATAAGYRLVGEHGVATGDATVDLTDWRLDAETRFGLYRFPEAPPVLIGLEGPIQGPRRMIGMDALQQFIRARYAAALAD